MLFILLIGVQIMGKNVILGLTVATLIQISLIYLAFKLFKYDKDFLKVCLIQSFIFIGILVFSYGVTENSLFVLLIIIFNIIFVLILYLLYRKKIRHWSLYLGIFIGSVIFVTFSFMFSILMIQTVFRVSDESIITLIYLVAIVVPVVLIVFEKDQKQLSEIKVGLYAWIAIITSIGALSFIYESKIEEYIYDNMVGVDLDINVLQKELSESENLKDFEEILDELNITHNFNGELLDLNVVIENIKEKSIVKISDFVDFLIKVLFLPHILGGTIGVFFVEWKEKRQKYKIDN